MITTELLAKVRKLHSSTIADVLDSQGILGWLDSKIQRLSGQEGIVFGEAYTVAWQFNRKSQDIKASVSPTWEQVKDFLAPNIKDGRGKIYVAGAGPLLTDMALAGGMSCTHFEMIGFEGVILGGAVRDAHVLRELRIPIMSTNFTPADTQGCYRVVEVGTSCTINNLVVHTGDWIFADESGCVIIPKHLFNTVINDGLEIEFAEEKIMTQLKNGENLFTIIEKVGRI
jgi:regulator of RNase E activity RraA